MLFIVQQAVTAVVSMRQDASLQLNFSCRDLAMAKYKSSDMRGKSLKCTEARNEHKIF